MRLPVLVFALFISTSSNIVGQRQADWSAELTGNAQQIIFQYLTGVPIIQTEKAYIGINPESKKVAWTAERSAEQALSGIVETTTDFYNMNLTPYVLVRSNLIDSRDGKGFLMNTAGAALTVGSAAAGTSGILNANKGAAGAIGSTFGMMPPGSGETELRRANKQINAANAMAEAASMMPSGRWEAFAQTRDHAYYFTKEKGDDEAVKLLVKVSKDTGEEEDKLIFDDARPLYQIDEIQKRIYYANKGVLKVFNM